MNRDKRKAITMLDVFNPQVMFGFCTTNDKFLIHCFLV